MRHRYLSGDPNPAPTSPQVTSVMLPSHRERFLPSSLGCRGLTHHGAEQSEGSRLFWKRTWDSVSGSSPPGFWNCQVALKHLGGQTDGEHHGAQTAFPKETWMEINNGDISIEEETSILFPYHGMPWVQRVTQNIKFASRKWLTASLSAN